MAFSTWPSWVVTADYSCGPCVQLTCFGPHEKRQGGRPCTEVVEFPQLFIYKENFFKIESNNKLLCLRFQVYPLQNNHQSTYRFFSSHNSCHGLHARFRSAANGVPMDLGQKMRLLLIKLPCVRVYQGSLDSSHFRSRVGRTLEADAIDGSVSQKAFNSVQLRGGMCK